MVTMSRQPPGLIVVALMLVCAQPLFAAGDKAFAPYEAIVDLDEELVRSGPSTKYYPTLKLKRGDKVTVHRHDPGGWYMISPPEGSFSWIQADYVQRTAPDAGVLNANSVVVRVGSSLGDARDVFQQKLSKGDQVEVLGEETFKGELGPVTMLKIKPPSQEFRWIQGRGLVPADGVRRGPAVAPLDPVKRSPRRESRPSDDDPFGAGPIANKPGGTRTTSTPGQGQVAMPIAEETISNPVTEAPANIWSDRLVEIDNEFRRTIRLEPTTWNLTPLEQAYRQIEEEARDERLTRQVKSRLDAIERYGKIKQEYDDFEQLTSRARKRDAELSSMTQPSGGLMAAQNASGPVAIAESGILASPVPDARIASGPTAGTATPAPGNPPVSGKRFDGAGVVQKSATGPIGAPPYVLAAPNGKLLAFLQGPEGVDLEKFVGFSVGVYGKRGFNESLQADLIEVRELQPVQLRSGR
jgi:hypothetical protein